MKTSYQSLWQHLLPQHLLSRLAGKLAYCEIPWIKNTFIQRFQRHYQVNLEEAEISDPKAFPHFNAFFTRALKPGTRPLEGGPHTLVSPADGAMSAFGSINNGQLFQAKNHTYSIEALLAEEDKTQLACFEGGAYTTIYLAPKDYHRVHMPIDGTLTAMRYIPGRLFSVNQKTAETIPGLFARNERVVLFFDTPQGPMALVFVGAMIVASISTVFAGHVAPDGKRIRHQSYPHTPSEHIHLAQGSEVGHFHLGSTVIMLLGNKATEWATHCGVGAPLKMGQALLHCDIAKD